MSDRLLTTEELAARLGVPAKWPLTQARAGHIPHVRLGRYVRFDVGDVEAWAERERRKVEGRPQARQ